MLPFRLAAKYLESPLRMEPERIGNFEIKVKDHPPGFHELAISTRTALMSGEPQRTFVHVNGIRRHSIHYVKPDGTTEGPFMSDSAQEIMDFAEAIHHMSRLAAPSNVLIGGLGLGYIAHWAARFGHNVTVVEIEPDVIKMTGKYLPGNVEVVESDLMDFLKDLTHGPGRARVAYDFAIFDTWNGQNESTYWGSVNPLRRAWIKAGGHPKALWAWKEKDEMVWQVKNSTLATLAYLRGNPGAKLENFWEPHRIFVKGVVKQTDGTLADFLENPKLWDYWARLYVRGLMGRRSEAEHWERIWGALWDEELVKAEAWVKAQAAQKASEEVRQ